MPKEPPLSLNALNEGLIPELAAQLTQQTRHKIKLSAVVPKLGVFHLACYDETTQRNYRESILGAPFRNTEHIVQNVLAAVERIKQQIIAEQEGTPDVV